MVTRAGLTEDIIQLFQYHVFMEEKVGYLAKILHGSKKLEILEFNKIPILISQFERDLVLNIVRLGILVKVLFIHT